MTEDAGLISRLYDEYRRGQRHRVDQLGRLAQDAAVGDHDAQAEFASTELIDTRLIERAAQNYSYELGRDDGHLLLRQAAHIAGKWHDDSEAVAGAWGKLDARLREFGPTYNTLPVSRLALVHETVGFSQYEAPEVMPATPESAFIKQAREAVATTMKAAAPWNPERLLRLRAELLRAYEDGAASRPGLGTVARQAATGDRRAIANLALLELEDARNVRRAAEQFDPRHPTRESLDLLVLAAEAAGRWRDDSGAIVQYGRELHAVIDAQHNPLRGPVPAIKVPTIVEVEDLAWLSAVDSEQRGDVSLPLAAARIHVLEQESDVYTRAVLDIGIDALRESFPSVSATRAPGGSTPEVSQPRARRDTGASPEL